MDTCNQVPKEGKALGNHVDTFINYLKENKQYNGVGWFILIMLDNWGKGNDELRALNIQFKIKDQKSYVKKKGRRRRRGGGEELYE